MRSDKVSFTEKAKTGERDESINNENMILTGIQLNNWEIRKGVNHRKMQNYRT